MIGDSPPPQWQDQLPPPVDDTSASASLDFDRLAANVLLTVQALHALHSAFDRKFTR